jgi:hypothetical protein
MRRLLTVVALAGSLVLPAGAEAGRVSPATLNFAHEAGMRYWQVRGVEPCPGASSITYLARRRPRATWLAWAWIGGYPRCEVIYNTATNWRRVGRGDGRTGREVFCSVIVHELGHLAGLVHTRTGIMRGDPIIVYPRVCRA